METLKLIDYLEALPSENREQFARRVGVTFGHLRNVAYGQRIASLALALRIARESEGRVPITVTRPKGWELMWEPPKERDIVIQSAAVHGESVDAGGRQSNPNIAGEIV